jgi:hypothetical protein
MGESMSGRMMVWAVAMIVFAGAVSRASAAEEKWTNVPVVDSLCVTKVKDNPDVHTRQCAIQCAKGGYGLIAEGGTYLRFDEKGNGLVIAALKAADTKDHLRATVVGERNGEQIKIRSFSLD